MLHIRTENLAQVLPQAQALTKAHWNETEQDLYGAQDYTLHESQYKLLEDLDMLHISAARDDAGQLCGYACFTITPCYHRQQALVATLDGLFLQPRVRKGMAVMSLLRAAEKALKAREVRFIQYVSPASRPCDALYRRLGAKQSETIFCKEV